MYGKISLIHLQTRFILVSHLSLPKSKIENGNERQLKRPNRNAGKTSTCAEMSRLLHVKHIVGTIMASHQMRSHKIFPQRVFRTVENQLL